MTKKEQITFYNCEICNKKYNRNIEALECERQHKKEIDFDNLKIFDLKEEHLKLLKETSIDWNECEFGSPQINPKRPYGNSSGVDDVAKIIGIKKNKETIEYDKSEEKEYDNKEDYFYRQDWNEKTYDYLMNLHKETQIALQIVLHCKTFELGKYTKLKYGWQKWIKDEKEKS